MTSQVEVRAPAEQTEGTRSQILRWLKQVGDPVAENEPLIELETDKVTVEVAAPAAGTLAGILKHEQEEISPGELLGPASSPRGACRARRSVPPPSPPRARCKRRHPPARRARRPVPPPRALPCAACWPSTAWSPARSPAAVRAGAS